MISQKCYKTTISRDKTRLFVAFACAVALFMPQPAHAQTDQRATMMKVTYNPKFMLGIGGKAEIDFDIDNAPGIADIDSDMEATLGGGLEVDFPVHKYFLLGGLFAFHSWTTDDFEDADYDRSYLLDFSLVPKVRYPFESTPLAIYFSLPIGFSLDLFDDDNTPGISVDAGLGMNISALAGVQFNLARSFGLTLELGYTYHFASHSVEASPFGITVEGDSEVDIEQFGLNVGVIFM
jgi:hypothetical protein